MTQKRPYRIQTMWPWILDAMSINSFQKQWVPWPVAKTRQDIINYSREFKWLPWTGHVPTPSAHKLPGYHGVLSLLQNQIPLNKKGRTSDSDTQELTDLLTIIIRSFKPEISQIGKIKLSTAELYSVLYNWVYDCEIKIHYILIHVYLPTKLWTIWGQSSIIMDHFIPGT